MPEISPIINGGAISRWVESTPPEETLLALNENGQVVASNAVMQSALGPIESAIGDLESGKLDKTDESVTNAREWTAETVSKAEAEAGTASTRRAWTALRVREAIAAWWAGSSDKAFLDTLRSAYTPVITQQPATNVLVATGDTITHSVTATVSLGTLTYQWQVSSDGSTWSNISGATSSSYTSPSFAISDLPKQYRCAVSSPAGTVYSNASSYFMLALDYYTQAAVAYSLVRLRKHTTAQIRVRRSSDSTEQDFTAEQITDGTLLAFCGSGSGFVTTWYDLIGSNHATQSIASRQPKIVDAGVLQLDDNGQPTIYFVDGSGVGQQLICTPWHAASTQHTSCMAAYALHAYGSHPYVLGSDPSDRGIVMLHYRDTGQRYYGTVRTTGESVSRLSYVTLNKTNLLTVTANRSRVIGYLDSSAIADMDIADRNADFSMPTTYAIGSSGATNSTGIVTCSCFIGFATDIASVQQALRSRLVADLGIGA